MVNTFDSLLDDTLGKNNWVCYTINLKRCPDRRKTFNEWANYIGLTFTYWDATDKLFLQENDFNECDVIVNNEFKSSGATACRLSHIRLKKYLLEKYNCKYFLIFEDDCGFNSNLKLSNKDSLFNYLKSIKDYPHPWDILWFGYHDEGMKNIVPLTDKLMMVLQSHRTHAILMSRTMCEAELYLCSLPEYKSLPIDWINDMLRNLKCITIGPYETIIDQVDKTSYTLSDNDIQGDTCKYVNRWDIINMCSQKPVFENGKLLKINYNLNCKVGENFFVPCEMLKSFIKNTSKLANPIKIISYSLNLPQLFPQDYNTLFDEIQNDPKIDKLYIQNCCISTNKIDCLPVGVSYSSYNFTDNIKEELELFEIRSIQNHENSKTIVLTYNCELPNYKDYIIKLYNPILDKSVNKIQFFNQITNYKYVLINNQHFDEQIIWELLMMNKIPIMNYSNQIVYNNLPILFINNLDEINTELLERKVNNTSSINLMQHWKQLLM